MPARPQTHAPAPAQAAAAVPSHPDLSQFPRTALVDDRLAAAALGSTPGTLCTWRSTGRVNLPYTKIGRSVRYRVGDLLDFIERRTVTHTGQQLRA